MVDECIFCRIVKGEVPCKKIWEDENFLAFLDVSPVSEGHTLVIPKSHFNNLLDLDEGIISKYLQAVRVVGEILMKEHNSTAFNVALNNGKDAGQVINHVHFHVLPRKEGDGKRGIFLG